MKFLQVCGRQDILSDEEETERRIGQSKGTYVRSMVGVEFEGDSTLW